MTNRILSTFRLVIAALTLTLTCSTLKAQSVPNEMQANIPFAFEFGATHYAPGVYTISSPHSHFLLVRGETQVGVGLIQLDSESKRTAPNHIIFHHYGNSYFLSSVPVQGSGFRLSCIPSKAERQAARSTQPLSAATHPAGNDVEVAAL